MGQLADILKQVQSLDTTDKLNLIQAITALLKKEAQEDTTALPYPLTDPEFRTDLLNQIQSIESGKEKMIPWEETEFYKRCVAKGLLNIDSIE